MELTIYTDGASRNNPGEAGAGVFILQRRRPVREDSQVSGDDDEQYRRIHRGDHRAGDAFKRGAASVKLLPIPSSS